jgi:hypothetical protein
MFWRDTSSVFLLNPRHEPFLRGEDRKLRDTGCGGMILIAFIVLLCTFVFSMFIIAGWNERAARDLLQQSGVSASARIVDHRESRGRRSTSYYLTYTFLVEQEGAAPQEYTVEENVDYGLYNAQRDGATVTITYLPQDPTVARLRDNGQDGSFLLILGLVLLVLEIWFLLYSLHGSLRTRRLVWEGELREGEIEGSKITRSKSGRTLRIKYSMLTPVGTRVTGQQSRLRSDWKNDHPPEPGTKVAVLYLDEKTHRIL